MCYNNKQEEEKDFKERKLYGHGIHSNEKSKKNRCQHVLVY